MHHLFKRSYFYLNLVVSHLFFSLYYFNRPKSIKLGNPEAAWWIPHGILNQHSIVYSGGVGNDISFELELIKKYQLQLYAFDPTPAAIKYISKFKNNKKLHFYPWGLWSQNKKVKFFLPKNKNDVSHSIVNLQQTNEYFLAVCKKISTIKKKFKHRHIDLLKIDIEGAEYEVLNSMLSANILPKIICVEFDQPASIAKMKKMIDKLVLHQYMLVKQDFFNFTFIRP